MVPLVGGTTSSRAQLTTRRLVVTGRFCQQYAAASIPKVAGREFGLGQRPQSQWGLFASAIEALNLERLELVEYIESGRVGADRGLRGAEGDDPVAGGRASGRILRSG